MSHPSDFGMLDHDGGGPPTHGDILAAIKSHARKTDEWIVDSRQWRAEQSVINAALKAELHDNTLETIAARASIAAVRDGLATARVVKLVAAWLGGIAIAIVAIWQLVKLVLTGELPPPPGP